MAEKSANNLLISIESSKKIPFERVLFGLGIRFVGETSAKKLVRHFGTIDALMEASYDELISVDEIGDKIAHSILEFFGDTDSIELIEKLKQKGIQFSGEKIERVKGIFTDKTIVVSGVFSAFSRDELKELIEQNGGKNGSSISSKTDFLLAGENMGPSKLKKAVDLGVAIISEDDFVKLLNN
jgi:DNA ligase (NAD+)